MCDHLSGCYTDFDSPVKTNRVRGRCLDVVANSVAGSSDTASRIATLRSSQSPLAVCVSRCAPLTDLPPLTFQGHFDKCEGATLTNNGQTAYYTVTGARPRLKGGPLVGEYIFEQMHFHWSVDDYTGCEHIIDGKGYAAECHLVHYNSKYGSIEKAVSQPDGLAVVGVLLESSTRNNPNFDEFANAMEKIVLPKAVAKLDQDSLAWLESATACPGYVTYKGSLTTPPFNECVTWILFDLPLQLGEKQIELFRNLQNESKERIDRNVRPTQRHPQSHSVLYVKQHPTAKL